MPTTQLSSRDLDATPAHDMEQALRYALRGAAQEDPDLLAAIAEHRNAIPGKKKDAQVMIPIGRNNLSATEGTAPVLDRSYFALLQQVSKLESDNAALTLELADAKEDAEAYADVARELEEDYNAIMAQNEEAERRAKAAEAATKDALARLAAAEAAIEALQAQQNEAAKPALMPSLAPARRRDLKKHEIISRGYKCVVGQVEHDKVVIHECATDLFRNHQMSELMSHVHECEAAFTAPFTAEPSVASTISSRRCTLQREAVEYRRAVRQQLQSAVASANLAGVCSSSGLFGDASKSCEVLRGLYMTPRDVLDGEVLSEDEEEEDVCLMRRGAWAQTLGLYHEA